MTTTMTASELIAQEEKKYVEQTITQFVKGTSARDIYNLSFILHEDFHALLSKNDLATVSKSEFMKMLSRKKLGGEDQQVKILSLDMAINTASAKVEVKRTNNSFEAYYHLFMEANGSWQILHVIPFRTI
jgi:hypothetical protein